MIPAQLVVKSKSSNSAIAGKAGGKKKCLSSQEVQEMKGSKKRGVYVAKKLTTDNLSTPAGSPDRQIQQNCKDSADSPKFPRRVSTSPKFPKISSASSTKPHHIVKRPRKGSFLNSVLNILSQETTGTQFPELEKNKKKHKLIRKRGNITRIEKASQDLDAIFKDTPSPSRLTTRADCLDANSDEQNDSARKEEGSPQRERKPRFRSRILNERLDERMVVLQSKKEIINTPSNYSCAAISKSFVEDNKPPDLQIQKPSSKDEIIIAYASNSVGKKESPKENEESPKENEEDPKEKEKFDAPDSKKHKQKVLRIKESDTLVSEQTNKNDLSENKHLYNFFVDLLVNTISSYELHEDNPNMEIDEHVAKKLNFQDQANTTPPVIKEPAKAPTVIATENVSVSKTKCYAVTDDVVTDRIEEIKLNPKPIIRKSPAPYVMPTQNPPYDSVLGSASFVYNRTRSASPMSNNTRSAFFGYNNNLRSNSFGYNNNMRYNNNNSFGYNNMRSNSFGYNNMRSNSFGYNNNMRSNYFGYNNMKSASFGYNNMRSDYAGYKNNMRSHSFGYQNIKFASSGRTKSFYPRISYEKPNKKTKPKKNKNQNLLSILKKELQMEDNWYEEPETFHQALKVIAKNKRRTQKAIHFDESTLVRRHSDDDDGGSECIFKRRRIISGREKKKQRKQQFNTSIFDSIDRNPAPNTIVVATYPPTKKYYYKDYENGYFTPSSPPSYHSIEVTGYDYETNTRQRLLDMKNKPIVYARQSKESILVDTVAFQSKESILAESVHSANSLSCVIEQNDEARYSRASSTCNNLPDQLSLHSMPSISSDSTTISQLLMNTAYMNDVTL